VNSTLRIGLVLGLFFLPALSAEAAGPEDYCVPQVGESLDLLRIDPSDIQEITYEANRHPGRDDDKIVRILAWINLYSCKGYVIIDMSAQCTVRQIYGRGGCKVGQCDKRSGKGCKTSVKQR
jgi:hypothetical protein